ncbi:signal peptidase, endoplasmic reticulum-type [Halorubrum aquaticum]|uniref:Signal peptidase, endoplasmic reticulum-type n=1 Tax=Halorubrum aquaticum TaxID=387340 RepID=A0A1I3BAJ0_9EURY|nr:signal peptidase I [Halorubrum aquaticum]SFH59325.1 signal peptidase, endoplasmic reticulum-type [Halorubrum aquaticum]
MNSPITLKRFANLLGIALLIAVVAPFVVYAVPAVVGAEYSFVVLTASMTPAIAPGDVVVVDERDPAAIAEGDVITFVRGESEVPVTHRVVGVTEAGGGIAFETKGDANEDPDSAPVPAANVLGAVAFSIPYIGYVIQFTDSPTGFTLLVILPFALLVFSEVWSLYRARTPTGGDAATETDDLANDRHESADSGSVDSESVGSEPDGVAIEANAVAEPPAESAVEPSAESGFVVTNRTVEGAVVVLLGFVPYAAYVAYTLQTALAVAVAVGTATTLLMAAVLLLTGGEDAEPTTADGDDDAPTDRDGRPASDERIEPNERPASTDRDPMGIFEAPEVAPVMDGGTERTHEEADEVER